MLRHVVMWKVKEEALGMKKPALLTEFKKKLEGLVGLVPEIRSLQVSLNTVPGEFASDIVLVSDFDDAAALKRYTENPDHLKVVDFVKQVMSERRVVDSEHA